MMRLAGFLTIFLFGFFARNAAAASAHLAGPAIDDVGKRMGFAYIGYVYTDGRDKFVCVATREGKNGFWKVTDGKLYALSDQPCESNRSMHELAISSATFPIPNMIQASFAPGGTVVRSSFAGNCGPNFGTFYTVTYPDSPGFTFYIVVRTDGAFDNIIGNSACDSQTIRQNYDSPVVTSFLDLGNGTTLLLLRTSSLEDDEQYLLVLRANPVDRVIAKDGIYLIPKQVMDAGGPSDYEPVSRYQRLLRIIGQSSGQ